MHGYEAETNLLSFMYLIIEWIYFYFLFFYPNPSLGTDLISLSSFVFLLSARLLFLPDYQRSNRPHCTFSGPCLLDRAGLSFGSTVVAYLVPTGAIYILPSVIH